MFVLQIRRMFAVAAVALFAGLSVPSTATAQVDTVNWFRITNDRSPGRSMDIRNDTTDDKVIMGNTGSYTGQYWRFEPAPFPDHYRLSTRWQGANKVLSLNNLRLAELQDSAPNPDQYWRLIPNPTVPNSYYLHNAMSGPAQALFARDLAPNQHRIEMRPTSPFGNQAFFFTAIGLINPASITQLGSGCDTGLGLLTLGPVGTSLPWINETMIGQMINVPTGSQSVVMFALQSSSAVNLGLIGAPNCHLYLNPLAVSPMPVRLNRSRWTLNIPDDQSLLGVSVFAQGAVISPAAQVFTSNAAHMVIGAH